MFEIEGTVEVGVILFLFFTYNFIFCYICQVHAHGKRNKDRYELLEANVYESASREILGKVLRNLNKKTGSHEVNR